MSTYKGYELIKNEKAFKSKMHRDSIRFVFLGQIIVAVVMVSGFFYILSPAEKGFYVTYLQQNWVNILLKFEFDPVFLDRPSFAAMSYLFMISFASYIVYPFLLRHYRERYEREFTEKVKRGNFLAGEKQLAKLLPTPGSIPVTSKIKVPVIYEPTNFLIMGSIGSGKTTLISQFVDHVRQRGEPFLVHDAKNGEDFVEKFYNPETDFILNTFDKRGINWNIFEGIELVTDFKQVARSVIPDAPDPRNQFFNQGAQDIFADTLRYCYENNLASNKGLNEILSLPVEDLYSCLRKVEGNGSSYFEGSKSSEVKNIRSILMQHAVVFQFLAKLPEDNQFSIRNWVRSEQSGGIFLTNHQRQREAMKGIIALFVNTLANEILMLGNDFDKRISVIIDEFGSLKKMDSLLSLLTLSRSRGGSILLGTQDKAQIDQIYGIQASKTIFNACMTKFMFHLEEGQEAEYVSRHIIGNHEVEKMESTVKTGTEGKAGGESYRLKTEIKPLVLPGEIQSLPKFHFYAKFHDLPIAKLTTYHTDYPKMSKPFILNEVFLAKTTPDESLEVPSPKKTPKTTKSSPIPKKKKKKTPDVIEQEKSTPFPKTETSSSETVSNENFVTNPLIEKKSRKAPTTKNKNKDIQDGSPAVLDKADLMVRKIMAACIENHINDGTPKYTKIVKLLNDPKITKQYVHRIYTNYISRKNEIDNIVIVLVQNPKASLEYISSKLQIADLKRLKKSYVIALGVFDGRKQFIL